MKINRWILRLIPFATGVAWVMNQMERKQKKKFSWWRMLALFGMVCALILSVSAFNVYSHMDDKYAGEELKGCVVVFGAAVWRGDQPSHALDDRVQAGIDIYERGVRCMVLSGGASTYGAHEADVMKKIAIKAGVKESDIVLDYFGNNTLATILNLKPEVQHVFVSNDFHLARINLMAKRLDFADYHLHAAPYQRGRYGKELKYMLREIFGTALVWIKL